LTFDEITGGALYGATTIAGGDGFAKAQRERTPGSARAAAPGLKQSKVRHSGVPSSLAKAGDP